MVSIGRVVQSIMDVPFKSSFNDAASKADRVVELYELSTPTSKVCRLDRMLAKGTHLLLAVSYTKEQLRCKSSF